MPDPRPQRNSWTETPPPPSGHGARRLVHARSFSTGLFRDTLPSRNQSEGSQDPPLFQFRWPKRQKRQVAAMPGLDCALCSTSLPIRSRTHAASSMIEMITFVVSRTSGRQVYLIYDDIFTELLTVGDLLNDHRCATYDELKEAILRRAAPNSLTALSSFLSSEAADSRTPTEILHHFQRLLTRTGTTLPLVMCSLFLKRLPAVIQQILLVPDAPLEHLALKADSMLAARAPTPPKATVSAATTTSAVTLGSLAAHVATLSEAVQKISTQERSRSRPRCRTPSPPHSDRDQIGGYRGNWAPINTYGEYSRSLSLEGEPAQRFQWIFLVADVPQPIIGADFLAHYGLTVDFQGMALIHRNRGPHAGRRARPTIPVDLPRRRRPSAHHRRRLLGALRCDG
ncbi:hypothetical protein C7M84_023917 [Penaeus vannamei]|uniref:Uncharacterized protein n=1 Tax=Penaeus vannamei TaxID=6689 RepID=A0A423U2S4_PENVA|nr:hypothetical protein C7M84_023917 [Penaeus vannamei]